MFDIAKFQRATVMPRTARVPLPALAAFFSAGAPAEFEVRGLEGVELAQTRDAVQRNKDLGELVAGILSSDSAEKIAAIREAMGIGDKVPDEIAKRLEMLALGSVEPKLDREACLKLCRACPIEFYSLTNKITELTGEGCVLGESTGSGPNPASEPPVPSATTSGGLFLS